MQIGVWLYRRHFDTKSVSAILQSNVFIKTKQNKKLYRKSHTHVLQKHFPLVLCCMQATQRLDAHTCTYTNTHAVTPILLSFIISVQNSINNHHATPNYRTLQFMHKEYPERRRASIFPDTHMHSHTLRATAPKLQHLAVGETITSWITIWWLK